MTAWTNGRRRDLGQLSGAPKRDTLTRIPSMALFSAKTEKGLTGTVSFTDWDDGQLRSSCPWIRESHLNLHDLGCALIHEANRFYNSSFERSIKAHLGE